MTKTRSDRMRQAAVQEPRVLVATKDVLWQYNHQELKYYARTLGIKVGKTKQDTIARILADGRATICAWLGD